MNRNEIVKKLINEGISEKTLVNLTDKQLSLLASRLLSEETLMISKKSPTFNQDLESAKKANKTIETYEQNEPCDCQKNEMEEENTSNDLPPKKKSKSVKKTKENDVDESARTLGFGYHGGLKSKKMFKAGNKRSNIGEPYDTVNEQNQTNSWVEGLVEDKYTPTATKGEIVNMVKNKLSVQLNEQLENSKLPLDTENCVYADGVSMDQSVAQKVANTNAKTKFDGKFPGKKSIKIVETAHRTKDNNYRYIVGLKVKEVDEGQSNQQQPSIVDTQLKEQDMTNIIKKMRGEVLPSWMKFDSITNNSYDPSIAPTIAPTKTPVKRPDKTPRTPYNPGKGTNPNPKAKY